MSTWIDVLALVTALGTALIAGAFFAFSNFIMRALGQQPVASGIASMQAINITVINPVFLGTFMGTAALGAVLIVAVILSGHPGWLFAVVGSLLYIVGTFAVTMGINVPMNNRLAAVQPESTEGAEIWARYLKDWTRWNTIRSRAALVATACLIAAIAA